MPLATSDLWQVDEPRSAAFLASKLDSSLAQQEERSLIRATNGVAGSFFWIGGAFKVVADVSQMMGPLLAKVLSPKSHSAREIHFHTQAIIHFVKERSAARARGEQGPPLIHGLLLALSSFTLAMTTSLVHHQVVCTPLRHGSPY